MQPNNNSTVYIFDSKVLSLLEAFFLVDLVTLKIQIMGGKITENLGFESLLR